MTEFIKCEDCPMYICRNLRRGVDETIIGCNYLLVNGDLGLTQIVHKAKPPAIRKEANSDKYLGKKILSK